MRTQIRGLDALFPVLLLSLLLFLLGGTSLAATQPREIEPEDFLELLIGPVESRVAQVERISQAWQPGYAVMFVEVLRFARDPATRMAIVEALEQGTGKKRFDYDIDSWNDWIWSRPEAATSRYAEFKSLLYRNLDPKFAGYFANDRPTTIRLDEIQWGGVAQDGIPPLHDPKMIEATEAAYLGERDVVFGIEINGDARAYPKRILAWHEMFTDTVGGVPVVGVYCTLCGSAILYETELEGVRYELGTSGFLYRSNKLMFDHATQSLWNTLWGRPVVGPLVDQDIQLVSRAIVTTRWRDWLERHPDTTVLSLDTGYERDYSEGAAYRDYFATDELMFEVPTTDKRLPNKAEVLALTDDGRTRALAISADYLTKHPLFQHRFAELELVILTDGSGANRAYRTAGLDFVSWDGASTVVDENDQTWQVLEDHLAAADGRTLERYPAHRAFWFGWHAAYPDTELIR